MRRSSEALSRQLYGVNTASTLSHLFLISLTAEHGPFDHSGHGVPLFNLDRLLVQTLDGHLLRLGAVSGHVLVDDLPRDLANNIRIILSPKKGTFTVRLHLSEGPPTFFTTMLPCSSVYFSSVTVCVGISGRLSAWKDKRPSTHLLRQQKLQTQYVDEPRGALKAVRAQLCCSAAIPLSQRNLGVT